MADDLMGFRESRLLIKNKYEWEAAKLGANIPPIKTPHGWLTIYHAVGKDKFYRLGRCCWTSTIRASCCTARPIG